MSIAIKTHELNLPDALNAYNQLSSSGSKYLIIHRKGEMAGPTPLFHVVRKVNCVFRFFLNLFRSENRYNVSDTRIANPFDRALKVDYNGRDIILATYLGMNSNEEQGTKFKHVLQALKKLLDKKIFKSNNDATDSVTAATRNLAAKIEEAAASEEDEGTSPTRNKRNSCTLQLTLPEIPNPSDAEAGKRLFAIFDQAEFTKNQVTYNYFKTKSYLGS